MMSNLNLYQILGVGEDATPDEIRKSYFLVLRRYHPDKNKGSVESKIKTQEIIEAYKTLCNKELRKEYDDKENIAQEQRERKQRERKQRERKQRERKQREREEQEKQRERKQRERKQREREEQEKQKFYSNLLNEIRKSRANQKYRERRLAIAKKIIVDFIIFSEELSEEQKQELYQKLFKIEKEFEREKEEQKKRELYQKLLKEEQKNTLTQNQQPSSTPNYLPWIIGEIGMVTVTMILISVAIKIKVNADIKTSAKTKKKSQN